MSSVLTGRPFSLAKHDNAGAFFGALNLECKTPVVFNKTDGLGVVNKDRHNQYIF